MTCYIKIILISLLIVILDVIGLLCLPIIYLYLLWRSYLGKEEYSRLGERLGFSSKPILYHKKTIWFHAVSVGEVVALFPLLKYYLQQDKYNILLTTSTVTSSNIVEKYFSQALQDRKLCHQYNALDTGWAIANFLQNWNICLSVVCESEIWPRRIISLSRRKIKQVIVNATMSERSFFRWQRYSTLSRLIFGSFDGIFCQNEKTAGYYKALGSKRVEITGNLKTVSPPIITDSKNLNLLQQSFKGRVFWAAISTHEGEEEDILKTYLKLKEKHNDVGLILVPRHPERCSKVSKLIETYNLSYVRKSKISGVINADILLGDTIGDIGLYLSLVDVCFVGKSLGLTKASCGGHNPIEPAMMGVAVISGKYVDNFHKFYTDLKALDAVVIIDGIDELYDALNSLLFSAERRSILVNNANKFISASSSIMQQNIDYLNQYLS